MAMVTGRPQPQQPCILLDRRVQPSPQRRISNENPFHTNNPGGIISAIAKEQGSSYWEALRKNGNVVQDNSSRDSLAKHERRLNQGWYRKKRAAAAQEGP